MIKSFTELGRYKIVMDEAWNDDRTFNPEVKIWYEYVTCHGKGFIYLKNQNTCVAYIPSIGILNNLSAGLTAKNITHTVERLDGEGMICFDMEDFKKAAKVLKAKKKRPAPKPEVIERLVSAGKDFRFSAGTNGIKTGSKIDAD